MSVDMLKEIPALASKETLSHEEKREDVERVSMFYFHLLASIAAFKARDNNYPVSLEAEQQYDEKKRQLGEDEGDILPFHMRNLLAAMKHPLEAVAKERLAQEKAISCFPPEIVEKYNGIKRSLEEKLGKVLTHEDMARRLFGLVRAFHDDMTHASLGEPRFIVSKQKSKPVVSTGSEHLFYDPLVNY